MADPTFRAEQWSRRFDTHVAPLNQLVDWLRSDQREWAPYVAPMYGGVRARLLSVLRDPGPRTQANVGSGFLCMENDDPTAEMICDLFAGAGITAEDVVPWNAYPWYINREPKAAELEAGVGALMELLRLLPNLRVVMLHGGSAHSAWKRLARRYPSIHGRGLKVIETYHTSRQAFWHKDPAVREARRQHLNSAFAEAAAHIASAPRQSA
jgi:hypothetical protein